MGILSEHILSNLSQWVHFRRKQHCIFIFHSFYNSLSPKDEKTEFANNIDLQSYNSQYDIALT